MSTVSLQFIPVQLNDDCLDGILAVLRQLPEEALFHLLPLDVSRLDLLSDNDKRARAAAMAYALNAFPELRKLALDNLSDHELKVES